MRQVALVRRLRRDVVVTFDDAFTSVDRVAPALERLGARVIVFACPDYADERRPLEIPELAAAAAAYPEELRTMGWDELRALARREGFAVESHTLSHPHLTQLDDAELERQLRESRERIADELGSCRLLAYPFGEEDARVNEAARTAGYDAAFGLPGDATGANRFSLPRAGVYRKDNTVRLVAKTVVSLQRVAAAVRR